MPGLMSIRRRSVHSSPCKLFGVVMHHFTHYSTLSLHIGVLLQNIAEQKKGAVALNGAAALLREPTHR